MPLDIIPFAPKHYREARAIHMLETAVAMSTGGLNRNKTQFCVTNPENGVNAAQAALEN